MSGDKNQNNFEIFTSGLKL